MARRFLCALALALLAPSAHAAPFRPDPAAFAAYANATFRQQGRPLVVKNLGTCRREGPDGAGYRCLSGELLEDVPLQQGRNFCRLEAIWWVPFSRTLQLRRGPCQFRSDSRRLIDQGQKLLRQGLEQLENR